MSLTSFCHRNREKFAAEWNSYPVQAGSIENKPFIFNDPRMAAGMQFEKGRRSGAQLGAFEWI